MKDENKVAIPVIIDDYGKYLLVTRTEFPEHKGEWGPIAGHFYKNESVKEALVREAKEELNLLINPIKQIAVIDQDIPGDIGFWWICKISSGEIKPNKEIDEYKFFSTEEIKNLKLWPATKKFFEIFIWNK